MKFGSGLGLRSSPKSNPLGPNHPVMICTWKSNAVLEIGADFGMTGGSIVVAERVVIGDRVLVGANTIIIDTDFHPIHSHTRRSNPEASRTAPVIIGDDVFIGMNCVVLKGVTIGRRSMIGAGSVVSKDVPPDTVAAGNPARVVRSLEQSAGVGKPGEGSGVLVNPKVGHFDHRRADHP